MEVAVADVAEDRRRHAQAVDQRPGGPDCAGKLGQRNADIGVPLGAGPGRRREQGNAYATSCTRFPQACARASRSRSSTRGRGSPRRTESFACCRDVRLDARLAGPERSRQDGRLHRIVACPCVSSPRGIVGPSISSRRGDDEQAEPTIAVLATRQAASRSGNEARSRDRCIPESRTERRVSSVMTPSVPSEPTKSWVKS